MSKRTVLNEQYKGLVENFSIPADLHERDGKKYASFESAVPIHCCTPDQVSELAQKTHHYCDLFTEQLLAPFGELAYVRLDENKAEKVFLNRAKRILVLSSDGRLAQWRSAATFESANNYVAGAPVVTRDGALVSLLTARRGNHYAVSSFEGEGGYFETSKPWEIIDEAAGSFIYADKSFASREELVQYIASLPPARVSETEPTRPLLIRGSRTRIALVAENGRQLMHQYLTGVLASDVEYL